MEVLVVILDTYKDVLKPLAEVYTLLTIEAVSGDETGEEGKFYKTRVSWRSQELSDFLASLNALHIASRYINNGKYAKGAFPVPRYDSQRPECTLNAEGAPSGLPQNWYDAAWLDEYPERRRTVKPTQAVRLKLPAEAER